MIGSGGGERDTGGRRHPPHLQRVLGGSACRRGIFVHLNQFLITFLSARPTVRWHMNFRLEKVDCGSALNYCRTGTFVETLVSLRYDKVWC